ncbi:50S ribosomal protein L3 N(5)-glutamine methyltransferase [Saccharospirillum impatiens]|uniref:50S ribosomal protein L3 N(5)-glutamine methyltransferase n=1 Tax=Saccharospirillum impatiens TaxID=169438 RepID=UPI00041D1D28|nr:50S ribosomal protein L3 N(5)-glutamine methyltransferase [Saccharospirillum impatiens]
MALTDSAVNLSSIDDQSECLEHFTRLGDWVRFAASAMDAHQVFFGHGFESGWDESVFLCLRALNLDWDAPPGVLSATLLPRERRLLWTMIAQRCLDRMPTAYLLEEAWFCGEPFRVTPDVLIPRSPIAELIEARFLPWLKQPPGRILDLCTGSGCIGIAMARVFPDADVDLSDLSESAVSIAVDNVDQKDLGYQVRVHQGDVFAALEGEQYDLIVANPPYVDEDDIDTMPAEFHHEPRLGLAAGPDGLELVHRILREAADHLSDDGWLICEVGNSFGALMTAYPDLALHWPEFERGGHGVFLVQASELRTYFT